MINFKAVVRKDKRREDKTYVVYIRVTYNRKIAYIPTSMVAATRDLTTKFQIKNNKLLDRATDLIRAYRAKLEPLFIEVNDVPFDVILTKLKAKDNSNIEFFGYCREWLSQHHQLKGLKNYQCAVNSFRKFVGREQFWAQEMCNNILREWSDSLISKPRAQSLYLNAVIRIYNDCRDYYNDYDNNDIAIKHRITFKPLQQNVAKKRALSLDCIKTIAQLDDTQLTEKGVYARDIFLLSFCLMGTNLIDLYNLQDYDGTRIAYNRTKTKARRQDAAHIEIVVPTYVRPIFNKYFKGAKQDRVFNFSSRFMRYDSFNKFVNQGLKEIAAHLQLDNLTFYAARHSFATIAVNDARVPIYIVNDMLCHIDESMRITNLYIRKDFTIINDYNKQFIDFCFYQ